jgi:tetratricopeptide (TPR) repeat protein
MLKGLTMRYLLLILTTVLALPAAGQQEPSSGAARTITPEMRGDIYMARKMFREAIDQYRSVKPASAIVVNKTGIAFHQMLDLAAARKHYERAAKMKRDYAEAYNNIGTIHYASKNFRGAVKYYKRALSVSPNSASIHSNLGTAYFARKDYERASQSYEQALRLDPEVFERRGTAGSMLQERTVADRAKFHYFMAKQYAKRAADVDAAELRKDFIERAIIYTRKALEEGFENRAAFTTEPEFAILKDHAEYQELLARPASVL